MRERVCVYRQVRSQTTEEVRDVGRRKYNCAGGCGAGNCAGVGYGVAAYVVSDDGDEALGGGDRGFAGYETAGYDDDGRSVGGSGCTKWEPRSG